MKLEGVARIPASGRLRWWRATLVVVTCAALSGIWFGTATGFPIEFDAYENLTAAYNLANHGVISVQDDNSQEQLRPSEYREPLPIIALAGYIVALDAYFADKPLAQLSTGNDARVLKYSNIPWALLLSVVVFASIVRYTGSYTLAAVATIAVHLYLAYQYDFLYSEIAAAALLSLGSCLLAEALRHRRMLAVFAAGLCFGALALTKAATLYVCAVLFAAFAVIGIWRVLRAHDTFLLRSSLLLTLGVALFVGPWMARNYIHFDSLSMNSRGGQVLLTRAVKNNMTAEEYRGAWYAYAPRPLRWITGELTGFEQSDLEAGGRLERLMRFVSERDRPAIAAGRPDEAVSYFARVSAMYAQLAKGRAAGDVVRPLDVDRQLKQRALDMILADPLRHLATIPLFLWRGAPYTFAILLACALYACAQRAWWLLAYLAPAMGLVVFYAVLTHFIPRYAEPMMPIAAVCFAVLAHAALQPGRVLVRHPASGRGRGGPIAGRAWVAGKAGQQQ